MGPDPRQQLLPISIQQMHIGPLPPPAQLADYEAAHPGAAKWIIDEATKNAAHIRAMEVRAIELQRRDVQLHRLLPFAVVVAFLIASVIVAFVNPFAGGAGLVGTMAGVLTVYLRTPKPTDPARPTSPATPR